MLEDAPSQPGSEPNEQNVDFVLPHRDAIREDNWPEWQARGIEVKVDSLPADKVEKMYTILQSRYGADHVYTGDAYDDATGKPLHSKPGRGIYIDHGGHRTSDAI